MKPTLLCLGLLALPIMASASDKPETPPSPVSIARPMHEQGQICYRHRSAVARLEQSDLQRALGSLAPGARVRVALPDRERTVQGTLVHLDQTRFRLDTMGGPVALERASVQSVWVERRLVKRGMLAGALGGYMAGMFLGAADADAGSSRYTSDVYRCYPEQSGQSDWEEIRDLSYYWGLPGALCGAMVGAFVALLAPSWQPVAS